MADQQDKLPGKLLWTDGEIRIVAVQEGKERKYDLIVSERRRVDRMGSESWVESEDCYVDYMLRTIANAEPATDLDTPALIPFAKQAQGFQSLTECELVFFKAISAYSKAFQDGGGVVARPQEIAVLEAAREWFYAIEES